MTKYSEIIKASRRKHVNPTGYKKSNPNPSELNKWLANDFMEQIKVDFEENFKDILKKYRDLEPLTKTVLATYTTILNNGLEGVDENTPVDKRRKIYNKKLGVRFWYTCFDYIKTELTGEKERAKERIADDVENFDKEDRSAHRLNFIINEVDTKANYDAAMTEAILTWLKENSRLTLRNLNHRGVVVHNANTKKPIKNRDTQWGKKNYMLYVYDIFKRKYIDGEQTRKIAKEYGVRDNVISMRNIKTIELIKGHIKEIQRLADKIYDEKYEFIL